MSGDIMHREILAGPCLREMLNDSGCEEKALIRLMLRLVEGRGCRLSANEVNDIIRMDQALHQRIVNEYDRMNPLE